MIENGCTLVEVKGKGFNIITPQGNLISDEWFDNLNHYYINEMIIYQSN